MTSLVKFDAQTAASIEAELKAAHVRLQARDTLTSRNYDSAIRQLGDYLAKSGEPLPTKSVLEDWRDDLLRRYALRTVNARLSAVRRILRMVADDTTDLRIKAVLTDWSKVADAKATAMQDKTEADYGRRLTKTALQDLIASVDVSTIKGLRDRAILALMAGAGLRVSEVVALTLRDVFLTENEHGQRGIKVVRGKHNKSRVVVLNGWNSWVIQAVQAYTDALRLTALEHPDSFVFRGIQRIPGGYLTTDEPLSARGAQRAVEDYQAEHDGKLVNITAHDLRRTYAKLCRQSGMAWEALRDNMGHSSVVVTEKYVGHDADWSERIPNWSIELDGLP